MLTGGASDAADLGGAGDIAGDSISVLNGVIGGTGDTADALTGDAFAGFFGKKKKGRLFEVALPEPPLEALVADTHAHLDMLDGMRKGPATPEFSAALALARCAWFGVGFVAAVADVCENGQLNYEKLPTWLYDAQGIVDDRVAKLATKAKAAETISVAEAPKTPEVTLPDVRIVVGCHPHNARRFDAEAAARLHRLAADPLTCAIGEVGLDFHYDYSPRSVQAEVFRRHIALAHESGLPLVLHLREAHEEAFAIMEAEGFPQAGVLLHCFNLDFETARPWLEHDCRLAFGGALTFKKNEATREALVHIDATRLMTETDAPFMTPEPMRSMSCEPAHVIFVAARLAEAKGCTPGEARRKLLADMYDNARELFDRPPTAWQLENQRTNKNEDRSENRGESQSEKKSNDQGEVQSEGRFS